MIHWLHAYEEDTLAGRLSTWMKFFLTLEPSRIEKVICDCLEMAGEFARESEFSLGKYTEGVERYLNQNQRQRRWRYDVALLSHTRLEYHLGMLGTEILSRTYRPLFNQTQRKVVIVPPCMRRQGDTCQGVLTPFGARCRACDPACAVHQLTKLGEKKGFEVFTIPDDLRKFSVNPSQSRSEIGVVGISCALTNWTGGWDLQKIGIPGQGVLLDYPGCQYHWSKHGVVTAVNFDPISRLCQEGVWDKS